MTAAHRPPSPALLTPQQVAERLLEEATLTAWRSHGRDGLLPIENDHQHRFRPADVEAFITRRFQAA